LCRRFAIQQTYRSLHTFARIVENEARQSAGPGFEKGSGCDERTEFGRLRYSKFADLREDQEEAENYDGKLK